MKTNKQTFWCVLGMLLFLQQFLYAQNCPPPGNFQIEIVQSIPAEAHLSWTAPNGGVIIGYDLTYSIDNQAPVTVNLGSQVTFFNVTLPEGWSTFEANIVTLCANGENSDSETVRTENLIIIDLVLAIVVPGQEPQVCINACTRATHFGYASQLTGIGGNQGEEGTSDGEQEGDDTGQNTGPSASIDGTVPVQLNLYSIQRFCGCMSGFGGDPSQTNRCKSMAADIVNVIQSNVQLCTGIIAPRNLGKASENLASIYPNPFDDGFIMRLLPQENAGTFRLFDVKGQLVYTQPFTSNTKPQEILMEPGSLTAGLYVYQIRLNDGSFQAGKLVKQ